MLDTGCWVLDTRMLDTAYSIEVAGYLELLIAYICGPFLGCQTRVRVADGELAQLARALAWHARGRRFDSDILHQISLAQLARASRHVHVGKVVGSTLSPQMSGGSSVRTPIFSTKFTPWLLCAKQGFR